MPHRYILIQQQKDLTPLLEAVTNHETVAIDTEADSQHHYQEQLCLIQLTVDGRDWIVDPLCGLDLDPLLELLSRRELLIHGSDYDLRLLHRAYQFRAERVFDTMLAAQMLGRAQIGLAAMAEEICSVVLPKQHQRADWSKRPLSTELLVYAAGDTHYLARISATLRAELKKNERLEWHAECCQRMIESVFSPRRPKGEEPWRIKGGKQLTDRAAAVLRELWQWREESAKRSDRPPFKIAANEFLLDWANWAGQNPDAGFDDAPPRPSWLYGQRLQAFDIALRRGLEALPSQWPKSAAEPRSMKLTREEEALIKDLITERDALAGGLALDPGVLGSREAIKLLVRHYPKLRHGPRQKLREVTGLMAWQLECLQPAVQKIFGAPATPQGGKRSSSSSSTM